MVVITRLKKSSNLQDFLLLEGEKVEREWWQRHTVKCQPHCETPDTLWNARHTVKPHCETPTTLWNANHTVKHQTHCETPNTMWNAHHTVKHQTHCEVPTTLWNTKHTVKHTVKRPPHCTNCHCVGFHSVTHYIVGNCHTVKRPSHSEMPSALWKRQPHCETPTHTMKCPYPFVFLLLEWDLRLSLRLDMLEVGFEWQITSLPENNKTNKNYEL